jgi:hypothetical protein
MTTQPDRVIFTVTDPDRKRRYQKALAEVDRRHGMFAWIVDEYESGTNRTTYIFRPMKGDRRNRRFDGRSQESILNPVIGTERKE